MTCLAEILTLTRTAQRQLAELRSLRSNPNHVPSGPHGGEFAPGGGSGHAGKHWAKRRRRRLGRLEKLRREGHAEIAELRAKHYADRKELIRDQRKDWAGNRKGQKKEWAEHAKEKKSARKELLAEHAAERKSLAREHAAELKHADPDEHDGLKASHANDVIHLKGEHNQAIRDHKESEAKAKSDLKEQHKGERESWLEDYRADRQSTKDLQHEERRELIDRLKAELHDEFPRSKSGRPRPERTLGVSGGGVINRKGHDDENARGLGDEPGWSGRTHGETHGPDTEATQGTRGIGAQGPAEAGRFPRHKTNKAGEAHAILAHCLKRRGWSKLWREGRLTGRQQLQLLEDIRQYGRAWLRHEAQGFFEAHGIQTQAAIRSEPAGILAGESGSGQPGNPGLYQENSVRSFGPDDGEREPRSPEWDVGGNQDGGVTDDPRVDSGRGGNGAAIDRPGAATSPPLDDRRSGWDKVGVLRSLDTRIASPLRRFFGRARQFIHELIFAGTMALKGPGPLSAQEVASLDHAARVQAEYLANFEREVIANPPSALIDPSESSYTTVVMPPPMTGGQFVARAELYANSAHQVAQNVVRQTVVGAGIQRFERIVLGKPRTEHCRECPVDAAKGWVPIGTLKPIGARECSFQCLCHFEYTDNPGGATTVNGAPRPPRKPRPVRPKPTAPTHAEIKAEVDKFVAGKPSRLVVGDITPRVVEPIPATPAPEGYVHVEAEYDADGNLIYKDVDE